MISTALNSLTDALLLLLQNPLEKRGLLENLDLVLLCLDETIDDGWVVLFLYELQLENLTFTSLAGSFSTQTFLQSHLE